MWQDYPTEQNVHLSNRFVFNRPRNRIAFLLREPMRSLLPGKCIIPAPLYCNIFSTYLQEDTIEHYFQQKVTRTTLLLELFQAVNLSYNNAYTVHMALPPHTTNTKHILLNLAVYSSCNNCYPSVCLANAAAVLSFQPHHHCSIHL